MQWYARVASLLTQIRDSISVESTYIVVAYTHADVVVANSTTKVLDANTDRKYAKFVNDSDAVMYLKVGADAVLNEGIRVEADGGSFEMSVALGNLATGQVNAIQSTSNGDKKMLVTEGEIVD